MSVSSRICRLALLSIVLISCSADDTNGPAPYTGPTVKLHGYAFEFGSNGKPVVDAKVRLAEFPSFVATSGQDGSYVLSVPDGLASTPYVDHPGFKLMHLQTFTTAGEDLTNVNFQMVSPIIYDIFTAILEVDADPEKCQISSTVNTKEIRDLDLEGFRAYGAHGVAGATVSAEPATADMVYFNENVVPNRTLTETSDDGGVVWPNVTPGIYVMSATHPDTSFASFTATCVAGRFINAGPPWGLREL